MLKPNLLTITCVCLSLVGCSADSVSLSGATAIEKQKQLFEEACLKTAPNFTNARDVFKKFGIKITKDENVLRGDWEHGTVYLRDKWLAEETTSCSVGRTIDMYPYEGTEVFKQDKNNLDQLVSVYIPNGAQLNFHHRISNSGGPFEYRSGESQLNGLSSYITLDYYSGRRASEGKSIGYSVEVRNNALPNFFDFISK